MQMGARAAPAKRVEMPTLTLVAIAMFLVVAPQLGSAQIPREAALEELKDSQWVRVSSPDVGRHEGRLLERTPTDLVISRDPHPVRLPSAAVDTLWTRGSSVGRGALTGAFAGALTGIVVGLAAAGSQDMSTEYAVLVGAGVGLGVGGVIGALVGAFSSSWHRRYP